MFDRHKVDCIRIHPRYRPEICTKSTRGYEPESPECDYDMAIITLLTSIDIASNSDARAACLPQKTDNARLDSDTILTVSGWGYETNTHWNWRLLGSQYITFGQQPQPRVTKREVNFVPPRKCRKHYTPASEIDHTFCYGVVRSRGKDQFKQAATQGDSGGKELSQWGH